MAHRVHRPGWTACRRRTAAIGCVLITATCSEPPESSEHRVAVVPTQAPSVRPTTAAIASPVAASATPTPAPSRRAFVDPPLPPELVDPPGLAPLPPRPHFTDHRQGEMP